MKISRITAGAIVIICFTIVSFVVIEIRRGNILVSQNLDILCMALLLIASFLITFALLEKDGFDSGRV
jgi:UPF0716 family protein affecting phage T7 exclusion